MCVRNNVTIMRDNVNIFRKSNIDFGCRGSIRWEKAFFFMIAILLSIPQIVASWPDNYLSRSNLLRQTGLPSGWQALPDELLTLPATKNRYPGIRYAKSSSLSFHTEYPLHPVMPGLVVISNCNAAHLGVHYGSSPFRIGAPTSIPKVSSTFSCCLAYRSSAGRYQVLGNIPCALKDTSGLSSKKSTNILVPQFSSLPSRLRPLRD